MGLRMRCPKCGQRFVVPEAALGKKARCKKCQALFAIDADAILPGQEQQKAGAAPPPRRASAKSENAKGEARGRPAEPAEVPEESPLRFDGIYQAGPDADNPKVFRVLRFYEDGTVIKESVYASVDERHKLFDWFHRKHKGISIGKYVIGGESEPSSWLSRVVAGMFGRGDGGSGPRISFNSESREGNVDFEGRIDGTTIHVRWHSHINGATGKDTYRFVKMKLKEDDAAHTLDAGIWPLRDSGQKPAADPGRKPLVLVGDPEIRWAIKSPPVGLKDLAKELRRHGLAVAKLNEIDAGSPILFCVDLADSVTEAALQAVAACAACAAVPLGLLGVNAEDFDDAFQRVREAFHEAAPDLFGAISEDELPALRDDNDDLVGQIEALWNSWRELAKEERQKIYADFQETKEARLRLEGLAKDFFEIPQTRLAMMAETIERYGAEAEREAKTSVATRYNLTLAQLLSVVAEGKKKKWPIKKTGA